MAMETAMVATIIDLYNHHYDDTDDGTQFTTFFNQEEEDQLLLESLDAELAQELQFQEALRASLILVNDPPPTTPAAESAAPPSVLPDPPVEAKWESGESSLRFCEICKERKEDREVVRNVYENDSCVCFGCINTSTSGKKGKPTKKQQHYRKKLGGNSRRSPETADSYSPRHQWIAKDSLNRRRRASSGDVEESLEVVKEKLKNAKEEIRVLMGKIQLQHQENTEAMDFQEQFFREQIRSILEEKQGLEEKIETGECNSSAKSSSSVESSSERLELLNLSLS
ncbi:hypothetical protein LINGRAHAP2_LOCUS8505 [Linum grandiflorum]